MTKSVRIYIKPKTYEELRKRGKFGDTWDSIICRLLERPKALDFTIHKRGRFK